ncbi:uncharacterized protein (DUF1684 family) [Mycetocola sp. CAN_C7]|uniref:DUF1684 domain-containing protein n=1 Tax=Mycetocola sp. CAN_C7 TaxID=2787724 RepID=UPI0018CBE2B6
MALPDAFDTSTEDFSGDWVSWHDARERRTGSPLGLASLAATHWLAAAPSAYDGVPGLWHAAPDGIVGTGHDLDGLTLLQGGRPLGVITGDAVTLTEGQDIEWGDRRLRYFERDGALALRLLDPDAPTRTVLRGIDAFEPDERFVFTGRFRAAEPEASVEFTTIDGHRSDDTPAGVVDIDLPDGPVSLTVTRERGGLHAVFADGTSGAESYRFRFLDMAPADENGAVLVDFNRAYLPPCAFSDFYVCPLPPAGNRFGSPIRAGEKNVLLAT